MVDEGFLTLDQLSAALAEQDRSGLPLGKVLVQLGFVSEGAVANALAEQHGGLLKTEFGISAGLGAHPKVALVPADTPAATPTPAAPIQELAPVPHAVVTERDALAKSVNKLQARLSESAQVYEAELARVSAAASARIAELEAEVQARSSESQAHEAEVARVTAAAVAHITKLEAELQARASEPAQPNEAEAELARVTAGAAARIAELETTVRLGATRLSELQRELAELRDVPVVEAPVVEAPVERAHLILTPSSSGYTVRERPGPAPASGTLLDVDGVSFVVHRVGASPFPGSRLRCVFLERA